MSESEFKKRSLTQHDMRKELDEIAKRTGYLQKDGRITPTEENIKAQIDYDYRTLFVPLTAIDEARKEILECKNYYAMKSEVEKWFGTLPP